jgi:hypothetical protein
MFPTHPTTAPGVISAPKPYKKHTADPMLQIEKLKPLINEQTNKKRIPRESQNLLKVNDNQDLDI